METIGYSFLEIILILIPIVGLLIWFIKSKKLLRRIVILCVGAIPILLWLADKRRDEVRKLRNEVVVKYAHDIDLLIDNVNRVEDDVLLMSYYLGVGVLVILIIYLERKQSTDKVR